MHCNVLHQHDGMATTRLQVKQPWRKLRPQDKLPRRPK